MPFRPSHNVCIWKIERRQKNTDQQLLSQRECSRHWNIPTIYITALNIETQFSHSMFFSPTKWMSDQANGSMGMRARGRKIEEAFLIDSLFGYEYRFTYRSRHLPIQQHSFYHHISFCPIEIEVIIWILLKPKKKKREKKNRELCHIIHRISIGGHALSLKCFRLFQKTTNKNDEQIEI